MLGKKIKELRKSSGMTQEELGKKLGVIKQTVSSWENDSSEPNHVATIALAKLFGVTTDYLLGAEGDAMGTEEKINEITQRVGRNIRSIREQAGLSQDEFAEGFSVKQPTVANWETGSDRGVLHRQGCDGDPGMQGNQGTGCHPAAER